jgi:hypothetical protein
MIIDRTHKTWGLVTCFLSLAAALAYYLTFHVVRYDAYLHDTVGGTPLGLVFGIVSFLIFIFAALLGWRRKHPSWRLGRMQFWMKGHIWLTFLTLPLVFMHAGFRFGGLMTSALMWVYLAVMLSGILGLILQHILPRIMKERLPNEVVFEQIPYLRAQLVDRARAIRDVLAKDEPPKAVATAGDATVVQTEGGAEQTAPEPVPELKPPLILAKALDEQIVPYLELDRGEKHFMGDTQSADDLFIVTKLETEERWHPQIDELRELVWERRQLDLQTKLQHWLHGWILAHAPLSFLLLILVVWHILVALLSY